MAYATLAQIAQLLKVTPRWINRLVKERDFPTEGRGKYDIIKCVHWRIDDLEKRISDLQGGTLRNSKERREIASAELLELELAELKKELIRSDEVVMFFEKLFTITKTKLLTTRKMLIPKLLIAKSDKDVLKILELRDAELSNELALTIENIIRGLAQSADQNNSAPRPAEAKGRRIT